MKILVKGEGNIKLKFRCRRCGSKYVANKYEYQIDWFSGTPTCYCPVCYYRCYGSFGVVEEESLQTKE